MKPMEDPNTITFDDDTRPMFCQGMLERFMRHEPGMSKRDVARKWFDSELFEYMDESGILDD